VTKNYTHYQTQLCEHRFKIYPMYTRKGLFAIARDLCNFIPQERPKLYSNVTSFIQRSSNSFIVHLHHTWCKVQTQDKFPTNVNGGHFILANNTLRNEHGSQAYDLGVGGILHLHLGVRFLVLLNKISVRTFSLS